MLKLKILPVSLQNLFFKILPAIVGISFNAYADNSGIIENLEKLLKINKDQQNLVQQQIQVNPKILEDLKQSSEVKLDPYFLKSLIFNSEPKYITWIGTDECRLYSTLENNLLKGPNGIPESYVITTKDSKGKEESGLVTKKDFFEAVYSTKCQSNQEFRTLFTEKNAIKTIEGIKINLPRTIQECHSVFQEWLDNPFLPYICNFPNSIKFQKINNGLIKSYQDKISEFQKSYFKNLCDNLDQRERFCAEYLKTDAWSKILSGELSKSYITHRCQAMMGTDQMPQVSDIKKCVDKISSNKSICETTFLSTFPALGPQADCEQISSSLTQSRLVSDYIDCPGNIDNDGVTNSFRIQAHFNNISFTGTRATCAATPQMYFGKMNYQVENIESWPLKICFFNRAQGKETCTAYFPGDNPQEDLSETKVISRILYQYYGAANKNLCRLIDSKTYNPIRSDFKSGCFIVFSAEECTPAKCDKKVYYENKVVESIRFEGIPRFEYLTSSFINERYSISSMLSESLKLKSKSIMNLTELKAFFDAKVTKSLIHGVGCIEDLLPELYLRTNLNQCRPTAFILDGYLVKNGRSMIITRISIDNVHSPRQLDWNKIYESVLNYQNLHPLQTWALYGIKN